MFVPVGYTEYGVFSYPDERLKGWRFGRFEYGGHAENCFKECVLWTPPKLDPYDIVELMKKAQTE